MVATARHVVVTGRVQGVFFRQSAVEKARELGVTGWVQNRADGAVEAHVEGEPEAVRAMLDWLRCGPAHAEVAKVQVIDAEPEGSAGFAIRH